MSTDGGSAVPVDDAMLMDSLRSLWERLDPVPADLAERVSFVLSLENLEVELLRMQEHLLAGAGSRREERARTVTFTSESLSVMVTLGDDAGATVRLDGWIDGGGGLRVELRSEVGSRAASADEDGRFAFDRVAHGLAQLVFLPTEGSALDLRATVVTPAIQV